MMVLLNINVAEYKGFPKMLENIIYLLYSLNHLAKISRSVALSTVIWYFYI